MPTIWFILRDFDILVRVDGKKHELPILDTPHSIGLETIRQQYLGIMAGLAGRTYCYSAEVEADTEAPEGMAFLSLRQLFGQLSEPLLMLAGRAVQIVEWDRTHQFCGRCGVTVEQLANERAKQCPQCGLTTYPRLSPAIIVRVERSLADGRREILLAQNIRAPAGFYSVLAGFVEPGESLEDCVEREIFEEVGIQVKNIRYFGSQPWPFPHSLMVGFTAEYASGELTLEVEELADAGWFTVDKLPRIPPSISIARRMIDDFLATNAGT